MRDTVSILPLKFHEVSFAVDGTHLLDRIDLTLARGETTILLGPNGAGKSLTLRLAHGLLTPTAGVVEWANGEGFSGGRKRHAMVFQKPVMLRRSLLANLIHAAASAGMGRREARAAALAALARFGFEPLARRPARLMSGGEQQRLAVARAWALDPQVLFLDEPTSHLDPTATRAIEEMLVAMAAEGRTLVMATHDLGQARRLATRVVFLHRGRVLENAEAGAFFTNPATKEARAFLAGELTW